MAKVPAGKVSCRDPQVCRGAAWHEPLTSAACGATKSTVLGSHNLTATPPRQFADAACPVHGIDPGFEADAAALQEDKSLSISLPAEALAVCSCAPSASFVESRSGFSL